VPQPCGNTAVDWLKSKSRLSGYDEAAPRGEDRPDSDVDLLVDLPPDIGLLGLGRVQAELEDIVGTKVDLVPAGDLKPAVRARAERDLVAL